MEELRSIELGETTSLALIAWKFRLFVRRLTGHDIFGSSESAGRLRRAFIKLCQRINEYMIEQVPDVVVSTPREVALKKISDQLETKLKYRVTEANEARPWGAFYRIDPAQTGQFLTEFFPGLSIEEAKLGREDIELSPKILVVYPGERLSWQFHNRRAERWRFLTPGAYYRSESDEQGPLHTAQADEVVQFGAGERHRLCAPTTNYTIVAEIWQHTDPKEDSAEDDIVRLQDDYDR